MVNTFDSSKPVTFGDIVSAIIFVALLPVFAVMIITILQIEFLKETYIDKM